MRSLSVCLCIYYYMSWLICDWVTWPDDQCCISFEIGASSPKFSSLKAYLATDTSLHTMPSTDLTPAALLKHEIILDVMNDCDCSEKRAINLLQVSIRDFELLK